jgi:multisubunit Na+/H+ antiporter MnhB subunit
MNKTIAQIAYYSCFVIAVIITYLAMGYAQDLAYSRKQPLIWVSVVAFLGAIGLVVLAIVIKAKYKI